MRSKFNLEAGTSTVFGEFSEKLKNNKRVAALSSTPLALILSACGSGSNTASTVLTLTKSADTYSASAVTGFALTDSASAKFDVSDATSNAYSIKLDATGEGVLEFDFVDANDTVTLSSGSKTSGFTTLKVTDGTVDATDADLSGITRVEVASGIKISLAQIKSIPTIVANSATSEITVEVKTEAEATELVELVTAGTVKVYGDTNPIKLVAAPSATVTTETLASKETETTSSVKAVSEAPVDTSTTGTTTTTTTTTGSTDPVELLLVQNNAGTVKFGGPATGDITIEWAGTAGASEAIFTRQGYTAENAIDFSSSKTINLASGQKISDTATDLNNVTVTGSGVVETSAAAGAQTLKVQTSANNILKTGDGDDVLEMGNSALLTADDVIDMGAGTGDTIKVTADGDTTGAVFNQYNSNVEKIVVLANSTAATHAKLTLNNSAAETGALEIDATALSDSSAKFTLALGGTAGNVDGALTVKGGADGDTITTGDGNDVIDANGGSDTVVAGAGDDEIVTDLVSAATDAVNGGTGTDTLKLVGALADANSTTVTIDLRAGQTDQISTVNTNWMKGNQTGIENFDVSGLTVTANAGAAIVTFTNLNATTDGATTLLKGTAASTDTISDIADGTDMSGITNTAIEILHLADGDAALTIDAANTTGVTQITGGSGSSDSLKLGEAAAFDLSAVTSFSGLEAILMNVTDKVATSLKIDQTGSTDFAGALTGATGTAQALSLTDSGDASIDITGITNTKIETISLVDDDDDLTIDADNLVNVTAIAGVSGGNVENLILSGASTFDLSAVTISNMTVKGTDSDAQTIVSSVGATTINFGGTGTGDTYKVTNANQYGDTVTNFQVGSSKDVINLQTATTYASSTVEGAKAGALASYDTWTEISNSSQHGLVILSDSDLTSSAAIVTALAAGNFDTTAASVIVVWEDSDNGSGVVEIGVVTNADTDDDDDVTYTTIATLADVADTTGLVAGNFDIVA